MAWWRTQSAPTPRSRWNQDDYHTAFAATSKAQIEQGVSPWQQPWPPGARRRPEKHPDRHAVSGQQCGLPQCHPNGEGLPRSPLGHLQANPRHGRAGSHRRAGHARAVLQV